MSARFAFAGLIAAAIALPVLAQAYEPNSPQPAPAGPNPGTVAANQTVQAKVDARVAANEEGQAQYEADRQAYLAALDQHARDVVANQRAIDRTDARYARQQVAYADAMAAWRWQVRRCKEGHQRACEMPPPNVADFY